MFIRSLGQGFSATSISYGAMGLSEFYGAAPPDDASLAVVGTALAFGAAIFDTAALYGLGHTETPTRPFLPTLTADQAAGRLKVAPQLGI